MPSSPEVSACRFSRYIGAAITAASIAAHDARSTVGGGIAAGKRVATSGIVAIGKVAAGKVATGKSAATDTILTHDTRR